MRQKRDEGDSAFKTDRGQTLQMNKRKRLLYFSVGLAVGILFLGSMRVLEYHLTFHAPVGHKVDPKSLGSAVEKLMLTSADGTRVSAWYFPVDGSQRTVLYAHGDGETMDNVAGMLNLCRELGFGLLAYDYRGYGASEGRPSEDGLYADTTAAYDYLTKTQKLPASSIIAVGYSLGTAMATDLASRRPVGALVLLAPFLSSHNMAELRYPWLPASITLPNRFNNELKITDVTAPVFIAHGDADKTIPYTHGERLSDLAKGKAVFKRYPGVDHYKILAIARQDLLAFAKALPPLR